MDVTVVVWMCRWIGMDGCGVWWMNVYVMCIGVLSIDDLQFDGYMCAVYRNGYRNGSGALR